MVVCRGGAAFFKRTGIFFEPWKKITENRVRIIKHPLLVSILDIGAEAACRFRASEDGKARVFASSRVHCHDFNTLLTAILATYRFEKLRSTASRSKTFLLNAERAASGRGPDASNSLSFSRGGQRSKNTGFLCAIIEDTALFTQGFSDAMHFHLQTDSGRALRMKAR